MTYIVVSPTEIVKAEMERPKKEDYRDSLDFNRWEYEAEFNKWCDHCLSLPRIPIHGKHNWKVWQEAEEGRDFEWGWFVKTESYQGEGGGTFKTLKEAEHKYAEWAAWDGQLQSKAYKPVQIAIPIQPTPEGEKVDERLNVVDYLTKRITELKRIDASFCNVRWDMSKHKIARDLARDMSNETMARRHELEDLLNLLTNDNPQTK